jgi:hypothetical protein
MRFLHFLLYRLGRAACWLASSCFELLYRLLSFCLQIPELPCRGVQERDKRKSPDRDFYLNLAVLSRGIRDALPLVFAPYHRLFCRKFVVQTQISLNIIATVYKLTICHNLILCLTASSQKVGGEYGMWEKGAYSGSRGSRMAISKHSSTIPTVLTPWQQ